MKIIKKMTLLIFLLTAVACGNVQDPYKNITGGSGASDGESSGGGNGGNTGSSSVSWKALSAGSNSVSNQNNRTDVLLFHAPASKPSGYISLIDFPTSTSVTVSTSGSPSYSINMEEKMQSGEAFSPNMINYGSFHTNLRILEKELLSSRLKQAGSSVTNKAITPKVYNVGDNHTFQIATETSRQTVDAKCVGVSSKAYYFIETALIDQMPQGSNLLNSYSEGFEKIYPIVIDKFGPEGDVDGNGKVIILFYQMDESNIIGYFYGVDKYEKTVNGYQTDHSNEADIFYMNTRFIAEPVTVLGTLSHEFQHMTYFNNKYVKKIIAEPVGGDDTWLNEGLSMLSSYYVGYADNGSNNDAWIRNFLRRDAGQKLLSLTYWSSSNYGYSALFAQYLNDVYGDGISKKIYADNATAGIGAIESATGEDFNNIFNNFAQALYLSGTGISSDKKLGFTSLDFKNYISRNGRNGLDYDFAAASGGSFTESFYPYSIRLATFTGNTKSVTMPSDPEVKGYAGVHKKQ